MAELTSQVFGVMGYGDTNCKTSRDFISQFLAMGMLFIDDSIKIPLIISFLNDLFICNNFIINMLNAPLKIC